MMYFLYDEAADGDGYVGLFTSIVEGRNMIRQRVQETEGKCSLSLIRESATKEEIEAVEDMPRQEYNSYWGIIEEPEDEKEYPEGLDISDDDCEDYDYEYYD